MKNNYLGIKGEVIENAEIAPYTSWKVGGKCLAMIFPQDIEDLIQIKKYIKGIKKPFFILGNGSNVLKSDDYYDGIVINLSKTFSDIYETKNSLIVGSGFMLPKLAFLVAKKGIKNFDFYVGIPGTVGGAVVMNAGSAGRETKDILKSVKYLDEENNIIYKTVDEIGLSFRKSDFLLSKNIIIEAEFVKEKEDVNVVVELTKRLAERRRNKFPLNIPTAGSTFKSPEFGPFPGKLIEEVGLRGYTYGGAKISEKHGNWIENVNNASFEDISHIINYAKSIVKEKKDIDLEVEIIKFE